MLHELTVLSSRFGFSNSNYNYDYTNANVGSHLCTKILQHKPCPHGKKVLDTNESVGTLGENDLLKAKATMNLKEGYIELIYETGWKKPVQAYLRKQFFGKVETYHFFTEWNTFDQAIKWLKHAQSYPIVINKQIRIGI